MKKLIVYIIIMTLLMGCSDLSNGHSKKNLPPLTFDKTIERLNLIESIIDPHDLIIVHDPIFMLVECWG